LTFCPKIFMITHSFRPAILARAGGRRRYFAGAQIAGLTGNAPVNGGIGAVAAPGRGRRCNFTY